jgi:hypothetical protein
MWIILDTAIKNLKECVDNGLGVTSTYWSIGIGTCQPNSSGVYDIVTNTVSDNEGKTLISLAGSYLHLTLGVDLHMINHVITSDFNHVNLDQVRFLSAIELNSFDEAIHGLSNRSKEFNLEDMTFFVRKQESFESFIYDLEKIRDFLKDVNEYIA